MAHVATPAPGENIAAHRKARGWSQTRLAREAGISGSYLTKVERGERAASPPVVAGIARALHVSTARIYGQPFSDSPSEQRDLLNDLRGAIRRHAMPREDVPDPAVLERELRRAERLRAETRYLELLRILPRLLGQATAAALSAHGEAGAWERVADLYSCAYSATHRLARPELSDLVVTTQTWAATRTWNPDAEAVARWNEAGLYQSEGEYADGLAVIDRAITQYEPAASDGLGSRHLLGSLHLRGVVLASRAKDKRATAAHVRAAHRLAEGMPRDLLAHNLTFGPGNTALYELASLIELGRPARAADLADPLMADPPAGLEPSRIGRLAIDAARAHLAARHHEDAARALNMAHRMTPEMAQVHPMAREVLRVLLVSHQRSRGDLMRMACRSGLLPGAL